MANETVEDIVREMRGYAADMAERHKEAVKGDRHLDCNVISFRVGEFAIRIKQAYEHKREATCEKSSQVGNNAEMRKALETILCFADGNRWIGMMRTVAALAKHGLSAPRLNCEVGTEREQSKRFDAYCYARRTYERGCGDCPLVQSACCEFAWGQLPYEEEETK